MQRKDRNEATPVFGGILLLLIGLAAVIASGDRVRGLLLATFGIAGPAALLAVAVGTPLGGLLAKTNLPGRRAVMTLLVTLLVIPPHVHAAAWQSVMGFVPGATILATPASPSWTLLEGWRGTVLLHAIVGIPWAALLAAVAFAGIDPQREEQARLEASSWRVLTRVSLPAAMPGVLAAGVLVAVLVSAEIAITDLMRVRTFAEEVYTQASLGAFDPSSTPAIGATGATGLPELLGGAVVLAVIAAGAFLVLGASVKRVATDRGEKAWRFSLGKRWCDPRRLAAQLLLAMSVAFLAGAPLVGLAYQAGLTTLADGEGGYRSVWSMSAAAQEIAGAPWTHRRELVVSVGLAVGVSLAVTAAATLLVGLSRGRVQLVLIALAALLIATPGPLLALGIIRCLTPPPTAWWAPCGWLYGGWFPAWLGQVLKFLPLSAVLLTPLATAMSGSVASAARLDGAGRLNTLWRVVLPGHRRQIAACWVMMFALSISELATTALLVPPGAPPVSVRLLSLLHYGVEERVAALSLCLAAGAGLLAWTALRLAMPNRFNLLGQSPAAPSDPIN
ncbi:ABC transporter permease [Botrimarina hoheduenensis]|uniref:Molybdate ABC transporter permease protein n=1 Tax=Botrimarina hoheduenensis TaxID=2528000 RepID=A0A5C5VZ84_9BACT|nr:iron ABC transporter permease [Botrimarina hoheduenensis]TWT43397.1 molybdate ABC transporter permease protein [Botrimarina hoheduenensis]